MKIAILGYSGSGKSFLSDALGEFYGYPVLHLDCIQFQPNWVERDLMEARAIVVRFLDKHEHWIIDGNYIKFDQKRRLEEATDIIFMNFPRRVCFGQALKRYWKHRNQTRHDMADGCIEKFDWEFVKWILWEGRRRGTRRHYQEILHLYPNKTRMFRTRAQVHAYLQDLQS